MDKTTREKKQTNINKGISRATEHLKKILGKDGKIIKAAKTDAGWQINFEVIEINEQMQKIGISRPVYDKNKYQIALDKNFDLISYEQSNGKNIQEA